LDRRNYFLVDAALAIPLTFARIFVLAKDQVLLGIDLDFISGVFTEQNPIARLHIEWNPLTLLDLAGADGHYFAVLRLLFGSVRNDDAGRAVSFASSLFTKTRSCRGVT
jgi:hypothetical protein